jgi:DNA-binding NarL/FixJ family response regulator
MRSESKTTEVAPPNGLGGAARYRSFGPGPESGPARRRAGEAIHAGCVMAPRDDADRGDVTTKLLIVDDYALYRDNLAALFAANGAGIAAVAWDVESLCLAFELHSPDVVLVNMATRDSATLLREVFAAHAGARVVALGISEDDERQIVACAEAGVAGYHLRSDSLDDLVQLIDRVANGESSCSPRIAAMLLRRLSTLASQRQPMEKGLALTVRENQILGLLDMGLSNQEIATRLCIAVHTVKNHVHSVLTKLDARSRSEAVARFRAMRGPEYAQAN